MAPALDPSTIVEKSTPELIARIAADFQKKVAAVLAQTNRFTWVLSGGHTPRQLFELLAREPYKSAIPWQRLWIFWGDERMVPPEDAESNYGMAQKALLQHVPIPATQIFRMKGELLATQAARDYEQQLQAVFGAAGIPAFDLILLGMGPDGHTASLFPGTAALQVTDRWVTDNEVPALKTTRLTLTLPILNHAREVWFLVTGAEKAAAYAHVRQAPDPAYPSSLITAPHGVLRWYVDDAIRHTA